MERMMEGINGDMESGTPMPDGGGPAEPAAERKAPAARRAPTKKAPAKPKAKARPRAKARRKAATGRASKSRSKTSGMKKRARRRR